ncbi:MAG: hypothetical protein J6J26_03860 [Bacteroides sp.]|nr:hypothetical protein [Bacteroides sp.]
MRSRNSSSGSSGIGTLGVLQVVFIVLKLCGLIDWSWWAVLIPLWIGLALIVLIIAVGVIITLVKNRKRNRGDRIKW